MKTLVLICNGLVIVCILLLCVGPFTINWPRFIGTAAALTIFALLLTMAVRLMLVFAP